MLVFAWTTLVDAAHLPKFLFLVRVEPACTDPVCLHFEKLSFKSTVINVHIR